MEIGKLTVNLKEGASQEPSELEKFCQHDLDKFQNPFAANN